MSRSVFGRVDSQFSKRAIRARSVLCFTVSLFVCSGCLSKFSVQQKRAELYAKSGDFKAAHRLYLQTGKESAAQNKIDIAIISFREAARIAHYELKDFPRAVETYRQLVLIETTDRARRDAQAKVAEIYFYDLQQFEDALSSYSQLLTLQPSDREEIEWRNRIVRSYYYLGRFDQAEVELDQLSRLKMDANEKYQTELLRANIHTAAKQFEKASEVLSSMLVNYPEKARADSIALMLAVSYEEQRDYKRAISVLESVREFDSRKAFIDEKLQSLRERMLQAPGARGLKK